MTETTSQSGVSIRFIPFPAHGHVNPMLPVVEELLGRGVRVDVVVGRRFAGPFVAAGAVVREFPFDTPAYVPERFGPFAACRQAGALVRRRWAARVLTDCAGRWPMPDVVVVDPMAVWGVRWANRVGVPLALFTTTHVRSRRRRRADLSMVAVPLELQPRYDRVRDRHLFVGPLLRPPVRFADLPWERIEAGPTLLVSPGTVYARGAGFYRTVAEAFADTSWCVVVSTGGAAVEGLGPLPRNVILRRHLPQPAVLRHAAVFVTHGGMNSVQESLIAGVPMVLLPRSAEQRVTARQVTRLDAGVLLAHLTPSALYAAVSRLHADPAARAAARRIGGGLGSGAGAAASALLGLVLCVGDRCGAR